MKTFANRDYNKCEFLRSTMTGSNQMNIPDENRMFQGERSGKWALDNEYDYCYEGGII